MPDPDRTLDFLRRALVGKPEDIEDLLEEFCGEDEILRASYQRLLDRDLPSLLGTNGPAMAFQLLNGRASLDGPRDDHSTNRPPTGSDGVEIPGYTITGQIGSGGMGVVYSAEQHEPRRPVAVKVIRGDQYVTEQQIRLFQREAHALGRLRHPSIAAIHEVGRTENGQHYFAMELVDGKPLNEFVHAFTLTGPEHRANLRVRLRLFLRVVEAVSYAHQRGIIHRDIKPGNVLVSRLDGDSENSASGDRSWADVKLLDFGLARITDSDVQLTTMHTSAGQILGTLAYMSPEQARGNPEEIDARSDVYSLGAVLYELLTDRLPVDVTGKPLHDAIRHVLEEAPTPLGVVRRNLRGDLETIVATALAKDAGQRYQSASALSDDLTRYLDNQPILARRPSTSYQIRKLVSRHRTRFAFLLTLFILVLTSSVVTSVLWQRQRIERQKAEAASEMERARLWESALAQARSTRHAGRVGRRFESLEAIEIAAELDPTIEVRNEAIAALAQFDLQQVRTFRLSRQSGNGVPIDSYFSRFLDGRSGGEIGIRNLVSGETIGTLPGSGAGHARYSAFDPSGRYLAVKYVNDLDSSPQNDVHTLRVWDLRTFEAVFETPCSSDPTIDCSPDGEWLAVTVHPGQIEFYALTPEFDPNPRSSWPVRDALAIHFSPEGDRLAIGGLGQVEVRELPHGDPVWSWREDTAFWSVAWSPDGSRLGAGTSRSEVHLFQTDSGEEIGTLKGHRHAVTALEFDGSSRWLVSGGWDGMCRVWDLADRAMILETTGFPCGVDREDDTIAIQRGYRLELWELSSPRGLRSFQGHLFNGRRDGNLLFDPTDRFLLSAGFDGVRSWDRDRLRADSRIESQETRVVLFRETQRQLLTGGVYGVRSRDYTLTESGYEFEDARDLGLQIGNIQAGALTRDENKLALLSTQGHVIVLDLESGKQTSLSTDTPAWHLTIDPAGRWLAAGGLRPWVTVWDIESGEVEARLELQGNRAGITTASPDGRWILFTTGVKCALWEVGSWERNLLHDASVGGALLRGVAGISPDGVWAALVMESGIKLLTLPDGRGLCRLPLRTDQIPSRVTFSSDGKELAVGYGSGRIDVWDLEEVRAELAGYGLDWSEVEVCQNSRDSRAALR